MNNNKKMSKGITLIALVVTIIVLLLLAGISIQMLTGNNGILSRAGEARTNTVHSNVYEKMQLEVSEYTIEKATGNYSNSLIDYLKSKSIIADISGQEDKWLINVQTLLGTNQPIGMGTYPNDVYVLEKQGTSTGNIENTKVASTMPIRIATTANSINYIVKYYGKSNNDEVVLGNIVDGSKQLKSIEERLKDYFNSEEGRNGEDNDDLGIKVSDLIELHGDEIGYIFFAYKNMIYKVTVTREGEVTTVEVINNTDLATLGEQINTFENIYYLKENGQDIDLNRHFSGTAYRSVYHDGNMYKAIYYNASGEILPIIHIIVPETFENLYVYPGGQPFEEGYYSEDTHMFYDTSGIMVTVGPKFL